MGAQWRTHSKKQIRQIAESVETFGFTSPVLIDETRTILADAIRDVSGRGDIILDTFGGSDYTLIAA